MKKINLFVVLLIGISAWALVAFVGPAMVRLAYLAQGVTLDAKDSESLVQIHLMLAALAGIIAPAAYITSMVD